MATLYEVAKEIEKETGIDHHTIMVVLKSLGNAVVKAMQEDRFEKRVQIPGLGILKIEKESRKKHPSVIYYPSPAIKNYVKNITV